MTYKFTASTATSYFYQFVLNGGVSQVLATETSNLLIVFTIPLDSAPVTAIGGYFFDTDVVGSLASTKPIFKTDLSASNVSSTAASFTSFAGFTSTIPFTSLTVGEPPASNNFESIDDLIVGTANLVLETTSFGLV